MEPGIVPFMNRFLLYSGSIYMHSSLHRENEATLYRLFVIHVPFKACLTDGTVQHAHVVTSIKQSHLSCPVIESFL